MDSPVDLGIYGPNSSFKNVNRGTNYTDNLLVMEKDRLKLATIFVDKLITEE